MSDIDSWLAGLPSTSYSSHITTLSNPRKRKRPVLAVLSGNTGTMPRSRVGRSSDRGSPSKRRAVRNEAAGTRREEEEEADEDASVREHERTPRLLPTFSLSTPSEDYSARSQSPVKMAEFQGLQDGLDYRILRSLNDVHPAHELAALKPLLRSCSRFAIGMGIIPLAQRTEIQNALSSDDDPEWELPHLFHGTDHERARLGTVPTLIDIQKICNRTQTSEERQDCEAGWNCAVHWPILDHALLTSSHANDLTVLNITPARIQPRSLLSNWRDGSGLRSKLIDFGITLEPDTAIETAYRNLDPCGDAPSRSLNCSCHNTLLMRPLAIGIETKARSMGETELPQIATWSLATFARLRELARASNSLVTYKPSPLPFLTVTGAEWALFVATEDASTHRKILWKIQHIAASNSVAGLYRIIAVLHVLMDWAVTVYRPWLHQILPLSDQDRLQLEGNLD